VRSTLLAAGDSFPAAFFSYTRSFDLAALEECAILATKDQAFSPFIETRFAGAAYRASDCDPG
jgi:hypothetical protein